MFFLFSEIIHSGALVKDAKIQLNSIVISQLLSVKNALETLSEDVSFHLTLWIQCQIGHAKFIHKQGKLCNHKSKYLKFQFGKLNGNGNPVLYVVVC